MIPKAKITKIGSNKPSEKAHGGAVPLTKKDIDHAVYSDYINDSKNETLSSFLKDDFDYMEMSCF